MKRLLPLFILLALSLSILAQNHIDALRYSQTYPGGTARSVAMGGAFGALGGDFYSTSQNPAGMGFYRSSEITITPEFYISGTEAYHSGTTMKDSRVNFNMNNFGYVTTFKMNSGDWKSASFSVGYNKIRNFSENIHIVGENHSTSFVDFMASSANFEEGNSPKDPLQLDPFSEQLFYEGYLMDYDDYGYYITNEMIDSATNQVHLEQVNTLERRGKMNEWVFSLAFNYDDFLYFGATFSILPVEYYENSFLRESSLISGQDYFRYSTDLDVEGTGYTGKFGVIVKPIHAVRLGLAYHLPTKYYFDEVYDARLFSSITGAYHYPLDEDGYEIDYGESDYVISTPGKAVGSLALLLGEHLLFSTDVEYIDYTRMELLGYEFDDQKEVIEQTYSKSFNAKSGVEVRFDNLYLRGGFGYFDSPYAPNDLNKDAYQMSYSGGIGFRGSSSFIDFTFYNKFYNENYALYVIDSENHSTASIDYNSLKLMMTVGFKF